MRTSEHRRLPRSAGEPELDRVDAASAAPGDAGYLDHAHREHGCGLGVNDQRVDAKLVEGFPVELVVIGLERAGERTVHHCDAAHPLDGCDAVAAGHDGPDWRAVPRRDRPAVHLPGEQHVSSQCAFERDRARERHLLARAAVLPAIRAFENNFARRVGRRGFREHLGD